MTAGPTELLFRAEPYLRSTPAEVIEVNARGGIVLDRTVFYATSGGQPGDSGTLSRLDGSAVTIATAVHSDDRAQIVHVPNEEQVLPKPGEPVEAAINWARRHRLMRMHTALHLLSVVFDYPVTGGSVGEDKGRLDFDMPEAPQDKETLEARLNELIEADHPVSEEWIEEAELDAQPDLVKTMRVQPPRGQGRIRLIRIGTAADAIDLQPCGGTHVAATGEIGPVILGKIEKKGRENRRVSVRFA